MIFFFIPIGKNATLSKFPWTTAALIALNTVVFFFTWPAEVDYLVKYGPETELAQSAGKLAEMVLDNKTQFPYEVRTQLKDEAKRYDFPRDRTDRIFEAIESSSPFFIAGDVDVEALRNTLFAGQRPVDKSLLRALNINPYELKYASESQFLEGLNSLALSPSLHHSAGPDFNVSAFEPEVQELWARVRTPNAFLTLTDQENVRLNRALLQAFYPRETARSLQRGTDSLPWSLRMSWGEAYRHYLAKKQASTKRDEFSIFMKYGFTPDGSLWPGLMTYQFLHAGLMHLFFNMLFLWIVGCNIEERWGPPIFLLLYLTGGAAAALVQEVVHSAPGQPLVDASGSVAAMMGAFLIRHYKVKIKIFYFVWILVFIRWGKISPPAWGVLPLWLLQEVMMGFATLGQEGVAVGYWAHVGGFIYGALTGLLIRGGNIASSWERSAETTAKGLDIRADQAFFLLAQGKELEAIEIYEDILKTDPQHLQALKGLLEAYEQFGNTAECGRVAVKTLRAALNHQRESEATQLFSKWKTAIANSKLSPEEWIILAQCLEKLRFYRDALGYYRQVVNDFPQSPLVGKALFACGKILKDRLAKPEEAETCFRTLMEKPFDTEWRDLSQAELRALGRI